MIASLPMYWRPETAAHWRAFWAELQAAAPALDLPDLTAPEDIPTPWTAHWLRPDLALSMTCGLPFRSALKGRVTYVGTLDFGLGLPPGHYASTIVARPGAAPPYRLAYNSADSQSGWAAAQELDLPFTPALETGAHAASLAAVAEGRADLACLDAISWRLLQRHDPNAARVTVLGQTRPTPGLPLVTAGGTDPAPLRAALATAVARFCPRDPMEMGGPLAFHVLDEALYLAEPIPPAPQN